MYVMFTNRDEENRVMRNIIQYGTVRHSMAWHTAYTQYTWPQRLSHQHIIHFHHVPLHNIYSTLTVEQYMYSLFGHGMRHVEWKRCADFSHPVDSMRRDFSIFHRFVQFSVAGSQSNIVYSLIILFSAFSRRRFLKIEESIHSQTSIVL